jgi:hypothetical protein
MSATKDPTQKVTFLYQNLHKVYQDLKIREKDPFAGEESEAKKPEAKPVAGSPSRYSGVLKAGDLKSDRFAHIRVRPHAAAEISKSTQSEPRTALEARSTVRTTTREVLKSLERNVEKLNELQARMRFLLKDLEDLAKD